LPKENWYDLISFVVEKVNIPAIPVIPESERTPVVIALLQIYRLQQEQIQTQQEQSYLLKEKIQVLKDEIARLKGHNQRPKIKPSNLEKNRKKRKNKKRKKRKDLAKESKDVFIEIDNIIKIPAEHVPKGSRFKGYDNYTIQDIIIKSHSTLFRLERWETPDGQYVCGKLPQQAGNGHLGTTLVSFILYQYYHAHVTQPLIWEQLTEFGIKISTGQINRVITEGKQQFHQEKDEILRVGLEVSQYIHVDDTSARHQGKNGYCTHIGNELFAWFESTKSKSRINFLQLLRGGAQDYVLNQDALNYMKQQGLPKEPLNQLAQYKGEVFDDIWGWESLLGELNILLVHHYRIATEGALLGSVIEHGINPEIVIISDDAGQFNVLIHALCWIHAERTINKLVGFTAEQREALEIKRGQIWDLYTALKIYKQLPTSQLRAELIERFDNIFTDKTCFATLNKALLRLHHNKRELLLVLDRPEIPLHNNPSERDIREYVKKRKISGSTRSDLGRRCRDTFASLKKTCRKLSISFWQYLNDRVSGSHTILSLPEMIRQRAEGA